MLRFAAIGLEMCSGVSEVKFDTKHATNALRMPAKSGEITQNPSKKVVEGLDGGSILSLQPQDPTLGHDGPVQCRISRTLPHFFHASIGVLRAVSVCCVSQPLAWKCVVASLR